MTVCQANRRGGEGVGGGGGDHQCNDLEQKKRTQQLFGIRMLQIVCFCFGYFGIMCVNVGNRRKCAEVYLSAEVYLFLHIMGH